MKIIKQINWKYFAIFGTMFLLVFGAAILPLTKTQAQKKQSKQRPQTDDKGRSYSPTQREVVTHPPVNFEDAARREELAPPQTSPWLDVIPAPKGTPPVKSGGVPIILPPEVKSNLDSKDKLTAPIPSVTGISPGPTTTFKGEFLSATSIPPDTMGAVGMNHVVNVTNDRMRITNRNGTELTRMTLTSFWAGVTIKGAAVSAFDPKILYDRFRDRWILISTFNAQSISSGAGFAVSQTGDPTGVWNRYTVAADPTSTATGGLWIDYPSIGFNKNWIVVNYNTFGYGTVTGYQRSDIFVLDKQAAYANSLASISAFQGLVSTCNGTNDATNLGCGFTMVPTVNEDNTTNTVYLVEDWDSTAGQLRMSKITGTPAAPLLTVGTQFPQSPNSWRFNASRIGTTGGYAPQRQQSANLVSGTRIMTNDSRIQNAVLRNGSLWTTHTVMLAATPTAAGIGVGGTANPDIRSAVQWWQVDPTQETGGSNPASVLQRGRIEDPTADNCHNGSAGTRTVGCNSTATQVGQFFAYPNISVNKDNDVLIGFTQFSALTYPSGAYAIRRSADALNRTRDLVVFRPGQANYNLGAGAGGTTARANRWGDYSASQTDPINDTDFWTVQEYAGTVRDFGIGLAGNWETWWANVKPGADQPVTNGNLIISEFRLRGPQGIQDEFIEVYNPSSSAVIVNTTDNSDGWAVAYSSDGTIITGVAVIPNGTVIPARGHFLVARNPDTANGPTLSYSLNSYPGNGVRGADSDVGYSLNLADNGGLALFKTSNTANFNTTTRMDSVGFSGISAGLFKEGTGITSIAAPANLEGSFLRKLTSGISQDTDDNTADFIFVDTAATLIAPGLQRLGAPGPENLDGPNQRNAQLPVSLVDNTVAAGDPPNQVYNSGTLLGGQAGTVSVRRNILNNTGVPVTRLRFRIHTLPTFPAAPGELDLRLLSSSDIMVTSSDQTVCGNSPTPCSLSVKGLTLEVPPNQPIGGGINSSVFAGEVTFNNPLSEFSRINVNFLFSVVSGTPLKSFSPQAPVPLGFNVQANLLPPAAPLVAASATVSGKVLSSSRSGIGNAIVILTSLNGEVQSIKTNNLGYFKFEGVAVGETYILTVRAKEFQFNSQVISVQNDISDLTLVEAGN